MTYETVQLLACYWKMLCDLLQRFLLVCLHFVERETFLGIVCGEQVLRVEFIMKGTVVLIGNGHLVEKIYLFKSYSYYFYLKNTFFFIVNVKIYQHCFVRERKYQPPNTPFVRKKKHRNKTFYTINLNNFQIGNPIHAYQHAHSN